jgi:hypothetical protein
MTVSYALMSARLTVGFGNPYRFIGTVAYHGGERGSEILRLNVFLLIARRKWVGCSNGRSPGRAPLNVPLMLQSSASEVIE